MGLLSVGTALSWSETKKYAYHVKKAGVQQFLAIYNRLKGRKKDALKWGDELEYTLVYFDHEKKQAKLYINGPSILEKLQAKQEEDASKSSIWVPEYASYMLEATPGKPWVFIGDLSEFNTVEANMKLRRQQALTMLEGTGVSLLTITAFPRIGCPSFTEPLALPSQDGVCRSLFFPDEAIYPTHPRFRTLTKNIRERRGAKVAMNLPIFRDVNTPSPFTETLDDDDARAAALPDHVYMDAMGFGMGCCCLQMTFQACSIEEARFLYDQLIPICPVVMALSAGSPAFRGYLTDTDCRWDVISGSVDCRTKQERGLEPLTSDKFVIPKSRYGTVDSYLCTEKYNDIDVVRDEEFFRLLKDGGVDELIAQHVAHLFIRDPVSLFQEKLEQSIETDADHFENIQSTNWQSMRFKPPPPKSDIGWRVEFRVCEIQMTDFENAAFACFVVLLTRVILSFGLNFYLPISKVDENTKVAQRKDAVRNEKFYFRRKPFPDDCEVVDGELEYEQMSINTIVNGKKGHFPGLIPLMNRYLDSVDVDAETRCTISVYLKLIEQKANGELMTTARWMREFITSHHDYRRDSCVSELINYDLMCAIDRFMRGEESCRQLVGDLTSST
ncbi:glutamate--cysteine ligase catalytic subunit-like [Corticium candelabrum]|uniref:glutamate--cysteine ligase catalytic subunit-like n=1 Tax=Corticium candelabrum TaxID=121492 RepID=UPI002E26949C|nr:glutamate--cysteine ligase catalytic subunit-like [Corticium candelabrum]